MDNDGTGCQLPEGPLPCFNNCGFFGSAVTMNFCSKCYRELLLKQSNSSSQSAVEKSGVSPVEAESSAEAASEIPSHRPANRCNSCNKRVGLTGFVCRCGNTYCSLHRYSDRHNCEFDYRTPGREAIAKANPVIKAKKIDKI